MTDEPQRSIAEDTGATSNAAQPPAGNIFATVAEHVEEVTRFGNQDLQEIASEQRFHVGVELKRTHTVTYEGKRSSGVGHLPGFTRQLKSSSEIKKELERTVAKAREDASEALRKWAQSSPGEYRRLMPPSAAFLSFAPSVGHQRHCPTCGGKCRVDCKACKGTTQIRCKVCYGVGRRKCDQCSGSGRTKCFACNGSGSTTSYRSSTSWDNTVTTETITVSCLGCNGTGGTGQCNGCSGDGKVDCASCSKMGSLHCYDCEGGTVKCSKCEATGYLHELGQVVAAVSVEETVSVTTEDDALRRLIQDRIQIDELQDLGQLLDVLYSVNGAEVSALHFLRLDATCARIAAQDLSFTVYGFGQDAKVFSFDNIAGRLLEQDLVAMEATVEGAARWRPKSGNDLVDTTSSFLRSELNLLIAEKVSNHKGSAKDATEAVERHFTGLVDKAYVERASKAVNRALARLYGSALAERGLYLCGIAAILAALLYIFVWPVRTPLLPAGVSLGAVALAWLGLEWKTRSRIANALDHKIAQRVLDQLNASGTIMRWRLGITAAAAMAVSLAVGGAGLLPNMKAKQAEHVEMVQAQNLIISWPRQQNNDYFLRQYPPESMLKAMAEAGDPKAQLILGWQLLLGAGGAEKDIAAARGWLDKAKTQSSQDFIQNLSWITANAVYVLLNESLHQEILTAKSALQTASADGETEATYWLSRIQLEERSPGYDPERGMYNLKRAAESGHAHANFTLGMRLAAAPQARRDRAGARMYLQRAADAGLPQAKEALATLQ